jgi:hypothetical protein
VGLARCAVITVHDNNIISVFFPDLGLRVKVLDLGFWV